MTDYLAETLRDALNTRAPMYGDESRGRNVVDGLFAIAYAIEQLAAAHARMADEMESKND